MKKQVLLLLALCAGAMCANAQTTGTENGHDWVDLGLPSGTLWATCNVGATAPEEYGDYFAWGEVKPKSAYNWDTYLYCDESYNITKYNYNSDFGSVDNKFTLETSDDAATANWGSKWRMPTIDEWQDLIDNCDWTWTTDYNSTGKTGFVVVSETNGNSIFFPAAGYRRSFDEQGESSSVELDEVGSDGHYWSDSLYTDYPTPTAALEMCFDFDAPRTQYWGRRAGLSVRPILVRKATSTTTALHAENIIVNLYTENGRIVCAGEFTIYDLLGRDVTRMNGQLNGVYIVKVGDKAQKVIVR